MTDKNQDKIALVGMSCMFPAAGNLGEYWKLVTGAKDAITEVPPTHWNADDYYDADPQKPDMTYAKRGGFLKSYPFDPLKFGIAPHALETTDTSQLLGMVVAHDALCDAGYGPQREFDRDRVSCIVGVTGSLELVIPLGARLGHPIWRRALERAGVAPDVAQTVISEISSSYVGWQESSFPGLLGNVVAGRMANRLNLGGTNAVVDAACGSSLGALHVAMMELLSHRADMVVTGGVDTFNDIFMYMCFSKTPALSPTGDARPFDKEADGTILGEGIGVVVIKRLSDAVAAGDRIYAVISGMGTSSDGKGQAIYAPSDKGQAKALRRAYKDAGVTPTGIGLIEGHGTGTKAGDATELRALIDVFREAQPAGSWCALGSVKSQIGHAKAAAGVAGLIKTTLALHHKVLPPTLKIRRPMDQLIGSPFFLNDMAQPWVAPPDHPRRAAVSSFGFGGSNFHCVLEEASPVAPGFASDDDTPELIALSHTELGGFKALAATFCSETLDCSAWRHKAAESRATFCHEDPHRLVIVCHPDERATLAGRVAAVMGSVDTTTRSFKSPDGLFYGSGRRQGRLAFLFPGQGAQYPNMLRDLAMRFPEMMTALDEASREFGLASDGQSLGRLIYPAQTFSDEEKAAQQLALRDTQVAQIAIGAVSAGSLDLLRGFGLTPDLVGGHSFGELTALYAGGVIDRKTLARLALARGRLMAAAARNSGGAMAAIGANEELTTGLLSRVASDELWVANLNGPAQTVVAGTTDALDLLEKTCSKEKIRFQRLAVSAAFHSPLVASACKPFAGEMAGIAMNSAQIDVYANVTAAVYPQGEAAIKGLLVSQIIKPVRFVDEIGAMIAAGADIFVEIGPSTQLTGLGSAALAALPAGTEAVFLALDAPSRQSPEHGVSHLARLLAQLAALGVQVNLSRWDRAEESLMADKSRLDQPRFTVSLCGANHVGTATKERRAAVGRGTINSVNIIASGQPQASHRQDKTLSREAAYESAKATELKESGMKQDQVTSGAHSDELARALARSHESLLALQKMQQDNAAIHKTFLEGQAQGQKMFYEIIRMQQELLSGGTGYGESPSVYSDKLTAVHEPSVVTSQTAPEPVKPDMALPVAPPAPPQAADYSSVASADKPELAIGAAPTASKPLEVTILEVLAEKTGYPTDMIKRDMDLEGDLGIDSIKRVEIFSALGERMAAFSALSPAVTGGLRTIQDILSALGAGECSAKTAGDGMATKETVVALQDVSVAPPQQTTSPTADRAAIERQVIEVIAVKTGYPPEMLTATMHLENDLGIDSIKRVEIFSALAEVVGGTALQETNRSASWVTISDIVEGIYGQAHERDPESEQKSVAVPVACDTAQSVISSAKIAVTESDDTHIMQDPITFEEAKPSQGANEAEITEKGQLEAEKNEFEEILSRFVVSELDISSHTSRPAFELKPAARIWVVDDGSELGSQVMGRIKERGGKPRLVDLDYLERIDDPSLVDGVIVLAPAYTEEKEARRYLARFFQLCTFLATLFDKEQQGRQRFVAAVTRQGGRFGFDGIDSRTVCYYGGISGLIKSAAQEWPDVACKLIDIDRCDEHTEDKAQRIVDECLLIGPLEVGLSGDKTYGVDLRPSPLTLSDTSESSSPVGLGDVVVVTGGARGVTAQVAIELARRCQPTMLILGRAQEPSLADEPSWLTGVTEEGQIKAALATHAAAGTSLADIHSQYETFVHGRAMRLAFAQIRQAGAVLIYRSVDVRDQLAVQSVITEIRNNVGPIRGIVHGAGVLRDRFLKDKTAEQFHDVMATKVDGFCHIMDALDPSELRLIALFSSSSARYGRRGQGDYAAANEILNKFAQHYRGQLAGCHVVALGFGPWQGGMVHPALARLFQSEGIGLIPLEAGASHVADELLTQKRGANHASAEVVIIGTLGVKAKAVSALSVVEPMATRQAVQQPVQLFTWDISLAEQPFLGHHIIGGRIVVPVVLLIEWLGHAALHGNPGLLFHGFDDLRVLKGIILAADDVRGMRAYALSAVRRDGLYEVYTEIRSVDAHGAEVRHACCKVVLADRLPEAATRRIHLTFAAPYARSTEQVYEELLFHGEQLMGIERIFGIDSRGCAIGAKAAPLPLEWLTQPLRGHWLADPLILDSAFQAVVLWTRECEGSASLPCAIRSYRQFQPGFPREGCLIDIGAQRQSDKLVTADCEFCDTSGRLIARMERYEAVMDPSLNEAFRKRVFSAKAGASAKQGVFSHEGVSGHD